ncbi:hypothetical protein [Helicobacter pylori]|uniref:hypothetical protein n=1 Tax=Helicobacter pylori TaxID=210 RepID=UPI002B4B21B1|nr:hypothetical protein [Helicobacter pylori]
MTPYSLICISQKIKLNTQEIKSKKQNKQEMKDKIKIRLKKIKPNDQTPLNPLKNNKPTKH